MDDVKTFDDFLKNRKSVTENDLKNIVYFYPEKSIKSSTCQFLLIKCEGNKIRENDFVNFMLSRVVNYVLKRKDYLLEGLTPEQQATKIRDIMKKAKSKFITHTPKSGEGGELILFLLLESKGIIQLLNKMNMKQSSQMPVFGLDAIHIQVDDKIILHYGESKMYSDFNNALTESVDSIKKFNQEKEEYELNLVSDYIDDSKFDNYTNEIIDIISPYSNKDNLIKKNSIFLGYNWSKLSEKSKSKMDLMDYFKQEYSKTQQNLLDKISKKLNKVNNDRTFDFYLMPFQNIDEFRQLFLEELKK